MYYSYSREKYWDMGGLGKELMRSEEEIIEIWAEA